MIVFENPGEIDPRSISTFGVSVKDNENPIGFFGTGLKYAIAVLLRAGHKITIQAGLESYEFDVSTETVRGKDFDFVRMATTGGNPVALGFTTELGKTWGLWMAYRELACNCRDESGETFRATSAPEPTVDVTRIIVTGDEFESIHADRWQYLLEDEPDTLCGRVEIRKRPSLHFFYRGVRVHKWPREAMFTYNDLDKIDLTEDRTVKNGYEVPYRIVRALLRTEDETVLRQALVAEDKWLEAQLDYHGWGVEPSPTFLKVVGQLASDRMSKVNMTALKVWREKTQQIEKPREIEMTAVQRQSFERALDFCGKIGFPIRGSYPIAVVETLGSETLGLAHEEKIFIAEQAFHVGGAKQVASTLIEEYLHLKHGFLDCTRSMQSFIFEKMVSLGEELAGEPL